MSKGKRYRYSAAQKRIMWNKDHPEEQTVLATDRMRIIPKDLPPLTDLSNKVAIMRQIKKISLQDTNCCCPITNKLSKTTDIRFVLEGDEEFVSNSFIPRAENLKTFLL